METELDLTYRDFFLGAKRRRISAPSEDLKNYQRSKLSKLETIYWSLISGSDIFNVAHGFLSNRGCTTAAINHIGYELTIMLDISKFFDSVTKDMVKSVSEEAAKDDKLFHRLGYTAQGFPTSPILANIASIPMLLEINSFLKSLYGEQDKDNKKFAFTIYADDIQISINRKFEKSAREENAIIRKIVQIAQSYNLTINPNKTRVRYSEYGFRRILGINVGDKMRATRKTMRRIRAAKHQNNYHSLGGLTVWSKCLLPCKLRKKKQSKDK